MPEKQIRLFLSKKSQRAALEQKWGKIAHATFQDTLDNCLVSIIKIVFDLREDKRNITPSCILAAFNALVLDGTTTDRAMANHKKGSPPNFFRPNAVYRKMKQTIPKNGICRSTLSILTHFMDVLGHELANAAIVRMKKEKRTVISERDIQIACLDVANIAILLKGRNGASWVPALTYRTKEGYGFCGNARGITE
jgi:histone H3/H4